jgi:hypothetical protein
MSNPLLFVYKINAVVVFVVVVLVVSCNEERQINSFVTSLCYRVHKILPLVTDISQF